MKKEFDCVALKNRIQKKQLKLLQNLTAEETHRLAQLALQRDPMLARVWKTARKLKVTSPSEN